MMLRSPTLLQLGGDKISQRVCLEDGDYVFLVDTTSSHMSSFASASDSGKPFWSICGHIGVLSTDFAFIKVSRGVCDVITPISSGGINLSGSSEQFFKRHAIVIGAFDLTTRSSNGWEGHNMSVYSIGSTIEINPTSRLRQMMSPSLVDSKSEIVFLGSATLARGAASQESISLHHPDNNGAAGYFPQFRITPTFPKPKGFSSSVFWIACGVRATLGENYKFRYLDTDSLSTAVRLAGIESPNCFEQCLPLDLLVADSDGYMEDNEIVFYFVQDMTSEENVDVKLIDMKLLDGYWRDGNEGHQGKNNVCVGDRTKDENSETCYKMLIGGGNVLKKPMWSFCGANMSSASVVEFCVTDSTRCRLLSVSDSPCAANVQLSFLVMHSSSPMPGWAGSTYQVSTDASSTEVSAIVNEYGELVVASGELSASSWFSENSLCIPDGCYRLRTSIGQDPERVSWFYCGVSGGAGDEIIFRLSEGRCDLQISMEYCTVRNTTSNAFYNIVLIMGFLFFSINLESFIF